jgi:hypothetical protein
VVDDKSAYFRLQTAEFEPLPLFETIKQLLRLPDRTV